MTEIELIVDSIEQDRERLKNDDKQKKYDLGKPKSHRFKNQIVITEKAE